MSVYCIEAVIAPSKEHHEKDEGNEHNREFSAVENALDYVKLLESHPLLVSYVMHEAPQTPGADYKHIKRWPADKPAAPLAPEDHMAALQAEIDAHNIPRQIGRDDEEVIAHGERHEHDSTSSV